MKKKIVSGLLTACIICTASCAEAEAANFVESANDNFVQNENIQTYGDDIIKKYRTHNGKRQYRHWNKTRHCWVEPYWIDL